MTYFSLVFYVASLCLFSSSMCNPTRPGIEYFVPMLRCSTVLCGVMLHRRLYGREK